MRRILAAFLVLLIGLPAWAQEYRISASGCARPGGSVTVSGSFARQVGQIILYDGSEVTTLPVRGWSNARVRVALPRNLAVATYTLVWRQTPAAQPGQPAWVPLGPLRLCAGGGRPDRVARDVVTTGGAAEYVVSVAPRDADAAAGALNAEGVVVMRVTPLPELSRVLLIVTLPPGLDVDGARDVLEGAAPTARIDLHHIYGFADGPRLYAAGLIGDDPGQPCGLRSPVAIGMIDGPLNPGHPALAGVETVTTSVLEPNERPAGRDHGTAVAGLMAGKARDFRGFAPGARVYAVTAFSAQGGGSARLEAVALGLNWLAGQGVEIVNLSMEGSPNLAFEDILARARASGLVMVAAAGNEATSAPRYPAASEHVIAVTAVDAAGRAYSRANTGAHIDLAAPGVDLYVAKGAGGGYRSGTSYAAPIVTALVARLGGGLSLDGALQALRRTARDLGPAGPDTQFGFGLVQTGGC